MFIHFISDDYNHLPRLEDDVNTYIMEMNEKHRHLINAETFVQGENIIVQLTFEGYHPDYHEEESYILRNDHA